MVIQYDQVVMLSYFNRSATLLLSVIGLRMARAWLLVVAAG
jgi:hypothetical protein